MRSGVVNEPESLISPGYSITEGIGPDEAHRGYAKNIIIKIAQRESERAENGFKHLIPVLVFESILIKSCIRQGFEDSCTLVVCVS